MEGLDVVAANFPRQRYQGLFPVGLTEIQVGGKVNNGAVHNRGCKLHLDLHTATYNFFPNEYTEVVNPFGLAVYKGSKQEWKGNSDCNWKVKNRK